jgi:5'-3' exonuclease
MLLDAASLYFRAFFGVPTSITSPDGRPINAVRGFLDMTARLLTVHRPARLVACWDDDWRPAFRVDALPSYKAHRLAPDGTEEIVPDELAPQVPILVDVLAAAGIARVGAPGYEADDVIGTLATRARGPVDVVTGDRDLFQLVDDDRGIRVLYTARGIADIEVVDEAVITEKYGIPGRAYADFATLRGDPSDGLPGVPGVGDKTAAALITRFGSLEGIEKALGAGETSGFPAGSRLKLEKARDYLASAEMVVRVVTDITLPDIEARVPRTPRAPERLVELTDRWNLGGPVNRLLTALKTCGD